MRLPTWDCSHSTPLIICEELLATAKVSAGGGGRGEHAEATGARQLAPSLAGPNRKVASLLPAGKEGSQMFLKKVLCIYDTELQASGVRN